MKSIINALHKVPLYKQYKCQDHLLITVLISNQELLLMTVLISKHQSNPS